jgi:hypothetical protein
MAIIQTVPWLTRGKVSTPGEPVSSCETYNRHECVTILIQHKDWRIGSRCPYRSLVEHEDLRELGEEQLLRASVLSTVVTLPIWNGDRAYCFCDGIGDRLLLLRGCDAELGQCIWLDFLVGAVVTPDGVRYLEPHEFIKEGNLIEEEVDELVRVTDVFSCGHMGGCLDALVECLETLFSFTSPDFREAHFDRDSSVLLILVEARLEVRDAEDRLEGCVDPTGSILVAKTEHSLLLEG